MIIRKTEMTTFSQSDYQTDRRSGHPNNSTHSVYTHITIHNGIGLPAKQVYFANG
jgi:hypothetical protein